MRKSMRERGFGPLCLTQAADPKSAGPFYISESSETAPARTEASPKRIGDVIPGVTRALAALGSLVLRVLAGAGPKVWT